MYQPRRFIFAFAAMIILIPLTAQAEEADAHSGFLTDYSHLQPVSDEFANLMYVAPAGFQQLMEYHSVMIDQPEIFIRGDSPYRGMKPDDMKALADSFREILAKELRDNYQVVEKAGPGVLYLRFALSDLYLKKKRRSILAYTPVGAVAHATKKALTKDITKKISLIELTVEGEILDSTTLAQLAAIVERRGTHKDKAQGQKADPTSWEELEEVLQEFGRRLNCRLDNARLPEHQWTDCLARPEQDSGKKKN